MKGVGRTRGSPQNPFGVQNLHNLDSTAASASHQSSIGQKLFVLN